ncbi:MAG: acyl-CoA dehydrogenase family protein [Caulobacterales bacterium]
MNLDLGPSDHAFRDEVRAFLETAFTQDLRIAAKRQAGVWAEMPLAMAWQQILHQKGWIAPHWPERFGGPGWSDVQRWIWETECANAGTPSIPQMGLKMCGPVLMRYGTPEQQAFFLPRILSGEHQWCQGYSEPQAGSDLAALSCHAERRGDRYIVNGVKIWTTYAHVCNWIFCLVRTASGGKPQSGISFLLIPMDTPGITVTPIITLSGDHEVNQVFFDAVEVPIENLVGEENDGWTVAKALLEFERSGAYASRIKAALRDARRVALAEGIDDPGFWSRLAALEIEAEAIDMTERRVLSELSRANSPGPASAMLKLVGTEAIQRVNELMVEAIGPYAAADYAAARHGLAPWTPGPDYAVTVVGRYLNNRAATIYGGSSEVQRNIIAKAVLRL